MLARTSALTSTFAIAGEAATPYTSSSLVGGRHPASTPTTSPHCPQQGFHAAPYGQ